MVYYCGAASISGINTAARTYFALMCGSTRRIRIYRVAIAMPVICSTVPQFQLRKVTTAGVTPGATVAPFPLDANDAATGAALQSGGFGTEPLVASVAFDMATLPLTAGAAWIWNFPVPIEINQATANGLSVYNAVASGATLGTFVASYLYDE